MGSITETALAMLQLHALGAAIVALAATVIGRLVRHAAVVHALWVVVLLKLLTPPLVELAVLPPPAPAVAPVPAETPAAAAVLLAPTASPPPRIAPPIAAGWDVAALLALAAGGVSVLALAAVRLRRFRRLLADAREAPPALLRRADELARGMGLARAPRLRVVTAQLSPMLWPRLGGAELLLPSALLERLGSDELDAVLAHELAHLRRRDPHVRWLELAAMTLFWWHPVTWWARHNLRRAEERSCDAWVAHTLPGGGRAYAEGLLKTMEFLAGDDRPLPAVATGIDARHDLQERLTMILTERTPKLLSPWHRSLLAVAAVAALAVLPTRADRPDEPEGTDDTSLAETGARLRAQELELDRREAELRAQLRALEARRAELGLERDLAEQQAAQVHLDAEVLRLQAAGLSLEAALYRQQQQAAARQAELRLEALESHREILEGGGREAEAAELAEKIERLRRQEELEQAEQAERAEHSRAREEAEQREAFEEFERQAALEKLTLHLEDLTARRETASGEERDRLDRKIRELKKQLAGLE